MSTFDPRSDSPRLLRLLGLLVFALTSTSLAGEALRFEEFYTPSVRGLKFSPKLVELAGQQVTVIGSMAPPLKASGTFLVLTKDPVSLCPFCQTDADWPADLLVVYLKKERTFVQKNRPLAVTGRLEIGSATDPSTGFRSLVRLVDADTKEL